MRARSLFVIALVILALVALWVARRRQPPAPKSPPEATATRTAVAVNPSPTAPPTSRPEPPVQGRSSFVVQWISEPTPTAEPTARPGPSPTPRVDQCVLLKYSAGVLPGTLGRILVDIRLENRCGRDLGPLEVWFWVGGYRQGDLVQSVRGHPFDPIPRGEEGKAAIVLPGSIDWYDRIEAHVIAPSGH